MTKRLLIALALTGCGGGSGDDDFTQCTPDDDRFQCETECVGNPTIDEPNAMCVAHSASSGVTAECDGVANVRGVRGCCFADDSDEPDLDGPFFIRWYECEDQ